MSEDLILSILKLYGPMAGMVLAIGWLYIQERKSRDAERKTYEAAIREQFEKRIEEAANGRDALAAGNKTLQDAMDLLKGLNT